MKIGLITIHNVNNYGALLQTYATLAILGKHGHASTINYQNKNFSNHLKPIRFSPSKRGLMMLAHDLLRMPSRLRVLKKFKNFISFDLKSTKPFSFQELKAGAVSDYDLFVCGSDQIWNPEVVSANRQLDETYFLGFAPESKGKISIASSIGHHTYSQADQEKVKRLLSSFSLITVREIDGTNKIKEILDSKPVMNVPDPTLLLSGNEWKESLKIRGRTIEERYLLTYSVPRTPLMKQAIDSVSKRLGLKVVSIDQMLIPLTKVDSHIRDAGPSEFVELFSNADFVVTDSFHGVCFSLNFGIPFVAVAPGKKSNRIESILSITGLTERIVRTAQDIDSIDLEINMKCAHDRLAQARQKALDQISESINDIKERTH